MLDAPVEDEPPLINYWQGNLSGTYNRAPSRYPALISWLGSSVERQSSMNG